MTTNATLNYQLNEIADGQSVELVDWYHTSVDDGALQIYSADKDVIIPIHNLSFAEIEYDHDA